VMKLTPKETLTLMLHESGLPFVPEYRFSTRRFKFDWALPDKKIGVEYEGGTFVNGAHSRGAHYSSDCTKYNLAGLLGWTVLRYTADIVRDNPEQIYSDIEQIKER